MEHAHPAGGLQFARTELTIGPHVSRRSVLAGMAGFIMLGPRLAHSFPDTDVTFLFINDVHACRTRDGLSPNCAEQGKTDENLLRHVHAINRIEEATWPAAIDGAATGLRSAGEKVATPRGIVTGGDITDDGGGQRAEAHQCGRVAPARESGCVHLRRPGARRACASDSAIPRLASSRRSLQICAT